MDNSQLEAPEEDYKKPKISNTWIYMAIIALLLGTNIYLFFQKKESTEKIVKVENQLSTVHSEKDALQKEYDASLVRLDELTGKNARLQKALASRDSDLAKAKARIEAILKKSNASETELKEARGLIRSLNLKIDSYEKEILVLKEENKILKDQKDSVLQTNESLQEKLEVAKILHASNIRLKAIDLRRGGRKQKETLKAKRVDLFRITFDIVENRIAEPGEKDLFLRIVNPEGELLSNAALGSGSFIKEDGRTVYYSVSKKINLQTGLAVKDIDVDWKQSADYEKGTYAVEIFYEGNLIGSGSVVLR